ncbi:MAG: ABC transporter permease [Desulfuromonadales bacterium C00003096]|jgi:NitT/TauT family transport system permease protein|nr:MAG: ABC transporter permease [Desulfuromonadales bacterium C00003096]
MRASIIKCGISIPAVNFLNTKALYGLIGVGLFVSIWQALSICFHEIIIASPADTFLSLIKMVQTVDFWKNVWITIERFVLSVLLGSLIGFLLGLAAGLNANIKWLLEPFRWSIMTMPPVVVVVVSMIWFGMGSIQTIFVTAILIIPIIYVNTIEGIEAMDAGILEMGRVYKANSRILLKEIYLPGIGGSVLAGLTLSAGLGIRIVVLAELLGAYSGVGYEFSLARTNLDTPALFAWIMVCLFLGGFIDLCILNPVRKRIMQWKEE